MTSWGLSDFEAMSWHDATLYAVALNGERWELAFDIDYIVEWARDVADPGRCRFRVSPCTLTFQNVGNVEVHVDLGEAVSIEVDRLERCGPLELGGGAKSFSWRLKLHGGGLISFRATGFVQVARTSPLDVEQQSLSLSQRGGISVVVPGAGWSDGGGSAGSSS